MNPVRWRRPTGRTRKESAMSQFELLSRLRGFVQAKRIRSLAVIALAALIAAPLLTIPGRSVEASSHMDAPSITLDPAANTTDVYAFVTQRDGAKFLST